MSQIVGDMFVKVQRELQDTEKNVYTDQLLLDYYNLLVRELNSFLMRIAAPIGLSTFTITADGSAQTFQYPTNFLAPEIEGVRPHNPLTSATGYFLAEPLEMVDKNHRGLYQDSTGMVAGTPHIWALVTTGGLFYVKFDIVPISGYLYDVEYWPQQVELAINNLKSQYTLWGGVLDDVLYRFLVYRAKAGMEFSTAQQEKWLGDAFADAYMIQGLRKLRDRPSNSTVWQGVDGC